MLTGKTGELYDESGCGAKKLCQKNQTPIIKKAAKMISYATRPVIIVGGGIKNTNGHAKVLKLAEILNILEVSNANY